MQMQLVAPVFIGQQQSYVQWLLVRLSLDLKPLPNAKARVKSNTAISHDHDNSKNAYYYLFEALQSLLISRKGVLKHRRCKDLIPRPSTF